MLGKLKHNVLQLSLRLAANSLCVWFAYTPQKPDELKKYNIWNKQGHK
ncbi:cyclic lactone autoinducer peptide [Lactiplantibacillus sp. WILCCON 0030]|uniref:Cyclic lactone autoinducer peptide n=1 Tax=Lactiplantibacillus brownii TaxID=3069269 RepID=A0ABU1A5C3_9LACO|nr:cyclic lactone autoinducer peptide [Lactiplantibacillus brownii]MDQ7936121.1 cyclic lactone autoinducer peptide [Lactiplantibacillus brownii]